MSRTALALAFAVFAAGSAAAADFTCPSMADIVQVGSCPTEPEMRWGFSGYCADNARMYDKDGKDICTDIERYKEAKNVSLWEAGPFQGYLSCTAPPESLKAAKLDDIGVGKAGAITRVVCRYEGGHEMVMRTRAPCTRDGDKAVCGD
ncbi:hypothetical protein [Magnetospirillum moscoviense]|uniref:Uncharacterized protein n=1 Tax=Magnetospirillum moscoviense TaxID=1437059 RepID=A0A178M4R5_9PROT|nr:hypothetical protein [Magnetospirillum moscoviense]OAN43731.1 hypothetical protein A6A05_05140 [Magnetospirillum moscoviense]